MTYQPPKHFAVINESTLVSDRDVAYWTEACRRQLVEHVCPAWEIGVPPGAAIYPRGTTFPGDTAMAAVFVDDIGEAGTLGLHGIVGGTPYVLIDAHLSRQPSVVLSHEFIEATVNKDLDKWTPPITRNGRTYQYPLEACDPVESATYQMVISLLDGDRAVSVSDFVYPEWFEPENAHEASYDYLGLVPGALAVIGGGYAAPEIDGVVTFIGEGQMALAARKFEPWGRLGRLMRRPKRGQQR